MGNQWEHACPVASPPVPPGSEHSQPHQIDEIIIGLITSVKANVMDRGLLKAVPYRDCQRNVSRDLKVFFI